MAFTQVTVYGHRDDPDGTPAKGILVFVPSVAMRSSAGITETVAASRVVARLDASGDFSVTLTATDDPATTPLGNAYEVTEYLAGQDRRRYWLPVPAASNSLDIDVAPIFEDIPGAITLPVPGAQGVSVTDVEIDNDGHQIVTLSDGSTIDAGVARGPQGVQGPQGEPGLNGSGAVDSVNDQVGTVVLVAEDVGAAPAAHTHDVDDLSATGVASATTFLRGDGTWAAPAGSAAYTDEQAQDATAVLFAAGTHTGVTFTYDDAAASMSATVTGGSGAGIGGWVDCSSMTTAAAINAASLAAGAGSTIWLGRRPSSAPLVLETTLVLRPYQRILGAGGRTRLTCVQAGASFTAGQPLIAAAGYLANATSADNPASVVGVHLNANAKSGSHGLVVYNFWAHFEDIQVEACAGSTAHGIHVTDRGINGTSVSTNSHSENTFVRCRFMDFTAGAHGFWAESTNGLNNSNQDGHLLDSFFAGVPGYGINITRAAGWTVHNNHMYGIGDTAIRLANCYATRVTSNYVEDFGGANTSGGYYGGISLETVLDTRATVVANNTVSTNQPSSPTGARWTCFYVRAGSGQLRANVVVTGNTATWASSSAPSTSRSWAFSLGEGGDTGRMLFVEWAANQIEAVPWWQTARYMQAGTVTLSSPDVVAATSQTGTTYTLAFTDVSRAVEMTNAAANTVTVPPNSAVAFPVGTVIEVFQGGAGQTTIAAGAGVTLRAPDGAKLSKQYASASLRKRATDEWVLAGSTST